MRDGMHLEGVTAVRVADHRRTGVALGWVADGLSGPAIRLRDDLLARFAATAVRPRWASPAAPAV
ncbi:MAG: hypothetical protein JJE52_09270 [Acidimicrobiia bacterium]|nr:hypothetical protein [Acidimicrobiia bacterium]